MMRSSGTGALCGARRAPGHSMLHTSATCSIGYSEFLSQTTKLHLAIMMMLLR